MQTLHELCRLNIESTKNFWTSIKLLLTKTHTVNRRLAGSVFVAAFELLQPIGETQLSHLKQIEFVDNISSNDIHRQFEICQIDTVLVEQQNLLKILSEIDGVNGTENRKRTFLVVNKLIPKNLRQHSINFELVVLDLNQKCVTFMPIEIKQKNTVEYQLKADDNSIVLLANATELNFTNWLKNALFKKFVKWCGTEENSNDITGTQSLNLVDLEMYNTMYNELKEKYGLHMVKIWPECTDPKKFVYEDIGIATYLLLLWQKERQQTNSSKKQSFVDLGCGNGLLVYILSSEGHEGVGIDIRPRGIWSLFPKTTVLKAETITPSDKFLFPTTDWIIGNHSDELSPWIPVIAARSSCTTRFFLLPCCAYEFDGSKFQRRNCNLSQYNDFLDYVSEICDICGFNTAIDRLKIPSTKRTCFIGQSRKWKSEKISERFDAIQEFIKTKTGTIGKESESIWIDTFKPRQTIEKVQNCTKIDKEIVQEIIKIIFDHLLQKKRYLAEMPTWNIGGIATLSDLAQLVPSDKLRSLKTECGGLKTLLKNHHQIFLVQKGSVQIRPPVRLAERQKEQQNGKTFIYQQKHCWLYNHHPDGCPFTSSDCSFKH